jgi:hypothetical protein
VAVAGGDPIAYDIERVLASAKAASSRMLGLVRRSGFSFRYNTKFSTYAEPRGGGFTALSLVRSGVHPYSLSDSESKPSSSVPSRNRFVIVVLSVRAERYSGENTKIARILL